MNLSLGEPLDSLAECLAAARLDGKADVTLASAALTGPELASAIQWRAVHYMGQPVAGYKIGATSARAREIMRCAEPFYGQLFASSIADASAPLTLPEGTLGLECEFAFRLARDLPGQDGCTADSAAEAVDLCCPAIEIVTRRTVGDGFPDHVTAIADFGLNGGFIHGEPISGWRDMDLPALQVVAYVDGEETNRGDASAVLGHPLNALAWLAEALARDGRGLLAGDWVSTGTCLGVVPARTGSTVKATFGPDHAVAIVLDS